MAESTKKDSGWHKKRKLEVSVPEFSKATQKPKASRVSFSKYGDEEQLTSSSTSDQNHQGGSDKPPDSSKNQKSQPTAPSQAPAPSDLVDSNQVELLCIQEYERGMEEGREVGIAVGLEQGIAEGIQRGIQQQLAQQAANEVNQLAQLFDLVQSQARQLVTELSICLAEKILRQQISQDPDWIQKNIQACFEQTTPSGYVRLRVHPEVRKEIMHLDPPPVWFEEFREGIQIVSDSSCELGGCILESEHSRVDARAGVQLEKLQEVLRSAMAGVLFTKD